MKPTEENNLAITSSDELNATDLSEISGGTSYGGCEPKHDPHHDSGKGCGSSSNGSAGLVNVSGNNITDNEIDNVVELGQSDSSSGGGVGGWL